MATMLKEYFPILKERETLLSEIQGKPELKKLFEEWTEEQQREFLDFCTGVRGIKFLYDGFFKEVMNAEYTPERLEEFLSLILGKAVKILEILPNDSTRIADEMTLLIMDIVVQLEDGTIVNLEVQKIGYKFPGERCACYSADLLLRQYKRVKGRKQKKFSYKDIKGVYTIVLFEKSPKEFHAYPGIYRHRSKQVFDSGLKWNLLQEYICIPLDIYKESYQNENMNIGKPRFENKLEAWLAFLCMDDPEVVIRLIKEYPEFQEMYEEAYQLCQNMDEVMQMFSKELAELDRNTVQLMIDEMQDEINVQKNMLEEKENQLEEKDARLEEQADQLEEKDARLEEQANQLEEKDARLELQRKQLEQQECERKTERVQMLRRVYAKLQNKEETAQLVDCSIEEVEAAVKGLNEE